MSHKAKPRSEIRSVSPEWAMQILQKHDRDIQSGAFKQRPLNQRAINRYASDMKGGNWALNGQGISFDEDGNLVDGQHRLYAVCKANVSVDMLILWDIPKMVNSTVRCLDTFDIGKPRTLGQQLRVDGFAYSTDISATARLIAMFSRKVVDNTPITMAQGIQIANLIQNHLIALIPILIKDSQYEKKRSYILAPLIILRSAEPDTADLFATEYNEMANLGKTNPILLYNKFINRPSRIKGSDAQIHMFRGLATALWAYCNDKKIDHIKTGADDHVEWLLSTGKGLIKKVREIIVEN